MTTQSSTRFFYLRTASGQIAACVAYQLDDSTLRYGVSTVHPGDAVSKVLARTISSGRLTKHPNSVSVPEGSRPLDILVGSIADHYVEYSNLSAPQARQHDMELKKLNLSREVCRIAYEYSTAE